MQTPNEKMNVGQKRRVRRVEKTRRRGGEDERAKSQKESKEQIDGNKERSSDTHRRCLVVGGLVAALGGHGEGKQGRDEEEGEGEGRKEGRKRGLPKNKTTLYVSFSLPLRSIFKSTAISSSLPRERKEKKGTRDFSLCVAKKKEKKGGGGGRRGSGKGGKRG